MSWLIASARWKQMGVSLAQLGLRVFASTLDRPAMVPPCHSRSGTRHPAAGAKASAAAGAAAGAERAVERVLKVEEGVEQAGAEARTEVSAGSEVKMVQASPARVGEAFEARTREASWVVEGYSTKWSRSRLPSGKPCPMARGTHPMQVPPSRGARQWPQACHTGMPSPRKDIRPAAAKDAAKQPPQKTALRDLRLSAAAQRVRQPPPPPSTPWMRPPPRPSLFGSFYWTCAASSLAPTCARGSDP
eukprot:7305297-Prymnesium_polylepis.1